MDTLPMPLDALAASHGGLQEFRLSSPTEIGTMLRRLCDDNVTVNLNAPDGSACALQIWTVDTARGAISFSANADDPQVQAVAQSNEAIAVCYLESIKLQFELHGLLLVHSGRASALKCMLPPEMFRFQRRSGYRVRPLLRNAPMARLRHPMIPEMRLSLRILDVSIGGCALFLPDDIPPLNAGVLLNDVVLELTPETRVQTGLRLQHVSTMNMDARGVRLGCEMVKPERDSQRNLQVFIDQTQKRRRLMSLD